MEKRQLLFKPTVEEEEYLEKTGKLESWTNTVRKWIAQDKKLNRKQLMDKIQGSLILIFVGIMAFMLGVLLPSMNFTSFFIVTVLFVVAAVSVSYAGISICWELYIYARR